MSDDLFARALALAERARAKRREARLAKSSSPESPADHQRAHWANYQARAAEQKVRSIARGIILENSMQAGWPGGPEGEEGPPGVDFSAVGAWK